jgi:hypothetical protein
MFKAVRFAVLLFLCTASFSSAATIYIDPGVATLYRGDAITTSVRIMPDNALGECINAIDAVITYSENIQPVDVSVGKSIFNVWVEPPVINKENRTITFAGGIPNGYCGRVDGDPRLTNIVAEIIFRSPGMQVGGTSDSPVASIDFGPETQVLLNDGEGTKAPLIALGGTFTLEKTAGSGVVDDWRDSVRADSEPPEEFSITLTRDDTAFAGEHFIVFGTVDKQTGISHYEVNEEPILEFSQFKWGGVGVPWVRTDSPYVLKDQTLNSVIRVKAIDKAGNEYIATLSPDESMQTLSRNELFTYIFIGALAFAGVVTLGVIAYVLFRRRQRSQTQVLSNENNDVTDIIE